MVTYGKRARGPGHSFTVFQDGNYDSSRARGGRSAHSKLQRKHRRQQLRANVPVAAQQQSPPQLHSKRTYSNLRGASDSPDELSFALHLASASHNTLTSTPFSTSHTSTPTPSPTDHKDTSTSCSVSEEMEHMPTIAEESDRARNNPRLSRPRGLRYSQSSPVVRSGSLSRARKPLPELPPSPVKEEQHVPKPLGEKSHNMKGFSFPRLHRRDRASMSDLKSKISHPILQTTNTTIDQLDPQLTALPQTTSGFEKYKKVFNTSKASNTAVDSHDGHTVPSLNTEGEKPLLRQTSKYSMSKTSSGTPRNMLQRVKDTIVDRFQSRHANRSTMAGDPASAADSTEPPPKLRNFLFERGEHLFPSRDDWFLRSPKKKKDARGSKSVGNFMNAAGNVPDEHPSDVNPPSGHHGEHSSPSSTQSPELKGPWGARDHDWYWTYDAEGNTVPKCTQDRHILAEGLNLSGHAGQFHFNPLRSHGNVMEFASPPQPGLVPRLMDPPVQHMTCEGYLPAEETLLDVATPIFGSSLRGQYENSAEPASETSSQSTVVRGYDLVEHPSSDEIPSSPPTLTVAERQVSTPSTPAYTHRTMAGATTRPSPQANYYEGSDVWRDMWEIQSAATEQDGLAGQPEMCSVKATRAVTERARGSSQVQTLLTGPSSMYTTWGGREPSSVGDVTRTHPDSLQDIRSVLDSPADTPTRFRQNRVQHSERAINRARRIMFEDEVEAQSVRPRVPPSNYYGLVPVRDRPSGDNEYVQLSRRNVSNTHPSRPSPRSESIRNFSMPFLPGTPENTKK